MADIDDNMMDFRESAEEAQKRREEAAAELVIVELFIDPDRWDAEENEWVAAPPVQAVPPTKEQLALYAAAIGDPRRSQAGKVFAGVFDLLHQILLDDGYERIMEKFEDPAETAWDLSRLQKIISNMAKLAKPGRPTKPATDSSSSPAAGGTTSMDGARRVRSTPGISRSVGSSTSSITG